MGDFDISLGEKLKIVDELLRCDCISNRESRETVLKLLNDQFPGIVYGISRRSDNRADVVEIVSTSLKKSGSLQELVSIVAYFEGDGSTSIEKLKKLLKESFFVPQIIDRELFEELKILVLAAKKYVTEYILKIVYLSSVPPDWMAPEGSDEGETLSLMLRHLAQAHYQNDGTLPILEFVERLVTHIHEPSIKENLNSWLSKASKTVGAGKVQYRTTISASPHLLVKFEPDIFEQNQFYTQAWYMGEQKENVECLHVDDVPRRIETVPDLLNHLLRISDGYAQDPEAILTIEFVLPFTLLNYDIHQWMNDAGINYPVVVRSLDRVYSGNEDMHDAWKRKWRMFEQQIATIELWFCRFKDCEKENFSRLLSEIICLALTFEPHTLLEKKQRLFTEIVRTGTPIALWPSRKGHIDDEKNVQKVYESLLLGCDFSKLPEVIWQKQCDVEDKQHLVHGLTLLWDDPNRLPPDIQFNAKLTPPIFKKGD